MDQPLKRAAGLIYGPELHHLDHLAVICHLMKIPLVVTEEEIAALARKYYPTVQLIHRSYMEIGHYLVENFEVIFYSMPRILFDEIFYFAQKMGHKRLRTIWCPHGNSDKGHMAPLMEALTREEIALLYGQKMIDFLIRKGVYEHLKAHVIIGNIRYQFYRDHQPFYESVVKNAIINRLAEGKKKILYAPTWQDAEKSSSFFDVAPILVNNLPDEYDLIIKLHPNLILQHPGRVEHFLLKYENHPQILILNDFPPIYPLLDVVDIYLGDMSSIGYDFLVFDKPMFFLNQNNRNADTDPGLYLYRCGIEIKPQDYNNIYTIIEKHGDQAYLSDIRSQVYQYTFGHTKDPSLLRQQILLTYQSFNDDDLDFYNL